MIIRFEDLWQSAGDGAFSPGGVARSDNDVDALMDAWLKERRTSTERGLYLEQMGRVLQKLIAVEKVPSRLRRRAKSLLKAVREARNGEP